LPTNYDVIKPPDNVEINNGYNAYYIKDHANDPVVIVFKDKDAEKKINNLEQFKWAFIGAILGSAIGMFAQVGLDTWRKNRNKTKVASKPKKKSTSSRAKK